MAREIHVPPSKHLLKLLEYYALSSLGHLPAEREEPLRKRVQETYRGGPDWKETLRGILKLGSECDKLLRERWQRLQRQAAESGLSLDPEQFVRAALPDIFPELARPKAVVLPEYRQSGPIMLKAIGFWQDNHGVFKIFPRPQSLVRLGWRAAELERILNYLGSGFNYAACGGWSSCRFGCAEGEHNGCGNFTDGEWMWPEGLGHYVRCHSVFLPDEFIQTMERNHWCVPDVTDLVPPGMWKFSYDFWLDWVQKHRPKLSSFWPRSRSAQK